MSARPQTTVVDLAAIRQSQLAWLIGRSPGWIRANGHLFDRDAAGRYNAQQAVAAVMAQREPAERVVIDLGEMLSRPEVRAQLDRGTP